MDWDKASGELQRKLDPSHVKERQQGGSRVSYVEGWHAIAEANRIFGHGEWTRETVDLRCVCERERKIGRDQKDGWTVTYVARVRVAVAGVVREGAGAGHGIGVDLGECHESALKEAETDAMKRALMTFGNPFGLALYDKDRANVGRDTPPFLPEAAAERIRKRIDAARTLPDLESAWKAEAETRAQIKVADPAIAQRLLDAAAERKRALLGSDHAMQAPGHVNGAFDG